MTIKEVVKLTGLSDKTLRYYESEGLIHVKRKSNGYREYSKKNIQDLNTIVLLRYLSVSLSDIKVVLEDPSQWERVRAILQSTYKHQKLEIEHQERLLDAMQSLSFEAINDQASDLLKYVDHDVIPYLETLKYPSLFDTIIQILVLMGPILWLVVGIYMDLDIDYKIVLPLASIALVLIKLVWRKYQEGKAYKIKRANTFVSFVLAIVVMLLGIGSLIVVDYLQNAFFTNAQTFAYVTNYPWMKYLLLFATIGFAGCIIFGIRGKYIQDDTFDYLEEGFSFIKRHGIGVAVVIVLFIYTVVSSVTIINRDGSLMRYGLFNLNGTAYGVEDIKSVHVGYNTGIFSQYQNDFYMKLRTDTFKLDIVEASYMEIRDTYDELVILDGLYFGIEKEVGNHNAKHCSYDRVYCEKFESIMDMRKE